MKTRTMPLSLLVGLASMAGGNGFVNGPPSYRSPASKSNAHRCGTCESCVRSLTKAQAKRERKRIQRRRA